jgi:hypothetical protein
MLAWEWPLKYLAGTAIHRSIESRLVFLPLTALASALLYQATNPAIYYTIALGVYFWAYSEGEVSAPVSGGERYVLTDTNSKLLRSHGRFLVDPVLARYRYSRGTSIATCRNI